MKSKNKKIMILYCVCPKLSWLEKSCVPTALASKCVFPIKAFIGLSIKPKLSRNLLARKKWALHHSTRRSVTLLKWHFQEQTQILFRKWTEKPSIIFSFSERMKTKASRRNITLSSENWWNPGEPRSGALLASLAN